MLDRRESIGDSALSFSPLPTAQAMRKGVSFADPRAMEAELDRERREEADRESNRRILEREADGDVTANLREMIQSLSPRKVAPTKGRKSLAVGSGKGLLGKRPAELDEEEEEEERDGVKRLKGLMGSPVKNVRLGGPPSKEETTTGRRTRAAARLAEGDGNDTTTPRVDGSPERVDSPTRAGRFKDVDDEPTGTLQFDHEPGRGDGVDGEEADEDRIHLQDFLNMTSIRFMELTTTKRRHTIAPAVVRESDVGEVSLENCVVAGACTVPMLELYQHVSLSL
jgi:kinetochore protein Spc7/SPC105